MEHLSYSSITPADKSVLQNEPPIVVQWTIYECLQDVRNELAKTPLRKSGFNKHLNFNYFELADFVPTATKLFAERGLCPIFSITYDSSGVEVAVLKFIKGAESITFTAPTSEPTNMQGIQALGAKITYMRRYMYMIALDLTENDIVDATLDKNSNKAQPQTINNEQWKRLNQMYTKDEIKAMYEELGINNGKNIPVDYYDKKMEEYAKKLDGEPKEFY